MQQPDKGPENKTEASVKKSHMDGLFGKIRGGSFFSQFFQVPAFHLLGSSICSPIQQQHLSNLPEELSSRDNLRTYNELAKQDDQKRKNKFLYIFLRKMIFWKVVIAAILAICAGIMGFGVPLVTKQILAFIKNKKATVKDQATAYEFIGMWIVLHIARLLIKNYSNVCFYKLGLVTQQTLTGLIMSKISRVSSAYKKYLQKGDLINHIVNDVRYSRESIQSAGTLFAAPATLIAVQVFLFFQAGNYGFTLVGMYLVGGIIQFFMQSKMADARIHKLNLFEERIGTNLELLKSIKHIKMLGWELLLQIKNKEYRKKENKYNNTFYLLAGLFELLLSIIPTLTILIIFILESRVENSQFDSISVYTMLSVIGMMNSPVRQLFSQVIKTIDGFHAMQRINHFLEAEEMKPLEQDDSLQTGQVIIDKVVMSWETEESLEHFRKRQMLSNIEEQDSNKNNQLEKTQQDLFDFSIAKEFRDSTPNPIRKPFNCKEFNLSNISLNLTRGSRLIILGFPDSGKTTFINMLLGNVTLRRGSVKINGKIGYMSQKLWFRQQSIRSNILIGRPENKKMLSKVYKEALLEKELQCLSMKDRTIMTAINNLSDGQKRRIAIARALYGQPDIILLDDPFISLDNETSKNIYENICQGYEDSVLVVATHSAGISRPDDNILIFQNGQAKEYGKYSQLLKTSKLLDRLTEYHTKASEVDLQSKQSQNIRVMQQRENISRKLNLREKLRKCIHEIIKVNKEKYEQGFIPKLRAGGVGQGDKAGSKRESGLPFGVFSYIFQSAPTQYVMLAISTILTYCIKVFSDWWLAQLKSITYMDNSTKFLIYAGVLLIFGGLFGVSIVFFLWSSVKLSDKFQDDLTKSLAHKTLEWLEKQKVIKLAGRVNKDFDVFYILNSIYQNIWKNVTLLIATLVLVGLNSPIFYAFGAGIIIINGAIIFFYIRTLREVTKISATISDNQNRFFEQSISGVQYTKAYNSCTKLIEEVQQVIYKTSVMRYNIQSLIYGVDVISQAVSMILMISVAFMAVANKFNTNPNELSIIGLTISFTMKIADITSSLLSDVCRVETHIRIYMYGAYELMSTTKTLEQHYDKPVKPIDWPKQGDIEFKNVFLKYSTVSFPIIKGVNFKIKSGENIILCGSEESGKNLILSAIMKLSLPMEPYNKEDKAAILINGVDISQVGRKYITDFVMHLDANPFIYTASIRENIDPLNQFTNQQIVEALKKVKLWDLIEVESEDQLSQIDNKLGFILKDAGANLSGGVLQKLNIARALLRKPLILLCESATSSLDPQAEFQVSRLIKHQFKKSTLIEITENISPILDSDKVMYFINGKLKEFDAPLKLLKSGGCFAQMVQKLEPQLYQKSIRDEKALKVLSQRNSRLLTNLDGLLEMLE